MHALGSWCERYRSGTGARQSDRSSLWIKTRSVLRLYFARSAPRSLHAPLRSHALVVRNEGEPPAQEVVAQLQDRPLDGQSFLLHGGVVLFGQGQLSADVQDGMLLTFLNLGQNGSQSGVGGIRLQLKGAAEVGGSQNWLRGERHLHPSQGLLCLGCPTHLLWLPLPCQVCQGGRLRRRS